MFGSTSRRVCPRLQSVKNLICKSQSLRSIFTKTEDSQTSRAHWLVGLGGLSVLASAWLCEELEIREAYQVIAEPQNLAWSKANRQLLDRSTERERLDDLLQPYVCAVSHTDIIFGHEGSGKSQIVKESCSTVNAGVLYVDLNGEGNVGLSLLETFRQQQSRSIMQIFRDYIQGGVEAHGIKVLEQAAEKFLYHHERYPAVVFDHVRPQACCIDSPTCNLLHLGRMSDPQIPSLRTILILDDAGLEDLIQNADSSYEFGIFAVNDCTTNQATEYLRQCSLPSHLAEKVVKLVGGRLNHLEEAVIYWIQSQRWLSPMSPTGANFVSTTEAHFEEIKKLVFWDLDKRLRTKAGINLWPAASGNAPVQYQTPTDQDAVEVIGVLDALESNPLPASKVHVSLGGGRFAQLLSAQVLGFQPNQGPMHKFQNQMVVSFGVPALRVYYEERLKKGR